MCRVAYVEHVELAPVLRHRQRASTASDTVVVWGTCAVVLGALAWSAVSLRSPLSFDPETEAAGADISVPVSGPLERYPAVSSVRDADLHGGIWFVLDAADPQVHRLDDEGRYLGSFARAGRGPGELRRPRALTVRGDTVFVATADLRLHAYGADGTHLLDRRIEPPKRCSLLGLGDATSSPSGLLLMFTCDRGEARSVVRLETEEGEFQTLAVNAAPTGNLRLLDPFRDMSVLAAHPLGFVFGHPQDDCLRVYNLNGLPVDSICHGWIPRHEVPVPSRQDLAVLRLDAAQTGTELVLPRRYPPFDRFYWHDGEPVYRTPLARDVSMSRLSAQGDSGLTHLVQAPVLIMSRGAVLAGWPEMEGMRMAVLGVDRLTEIP